MFPLWVGGTIDHGQQGPVHFACVGVRIVIVIGAFTKNAIMKPEIIFKENQRLKKRMLCMAGGYVCK